MLQFWTFAFALFVAIASFTDAPYPENVKKWTNSTYVWQILSIITIVASSIGVFETYRVLGGGGGYN